MTLATTDVLGSAVVSVALMVNPAVVWLSAATDSLSP
jgi:hypothetical protein